MTTIILIITMVFFGHLIYLSEFRRKLDLSTPFYFRTSEEIYYITYLGGNGLYDIVNHGLGSYIKEVSDNNFYPANKYWHYISYVL